MCAEIHGLPAFKFGESLTVKSPCEQLFDDLMLVLAVGAMISGDRKTLDATIEAIMEDRPAEYDIILIGGHVPAPFTSEYSREELIEMNDRPMDQPIDLRRLLAA